jgi:UDP-2-acetamido-2-deoxy-ribo-hexuluronate aminotransferase
MDTLQCAIVLAKLERFEWELEQRAKVASHYHTLLSDRVGQVECASECSSVYAQFTVVVEERERIQQALQAAGIPTAVHYPVPIHLQPAYAHLCCPDCCPVALDMSRKVLSLPMDPYLQNAEIQQVVATLLQAAVAPRSGTAEDAPPPRQARGAAETTM